MVSPNRGSETVERSRQIVCRTLEATISAGDGGGGSGRDRSGGNPNDVVESVHVSFLEAGVDAIETNTFGANKIVLAEFDMADRTRALNQSAARIARRCADQSTREDR